MIRRPARITPTLKRPSTPISPYDTGYFAGLQNGQIAAIAAYEELHGRDGLKRFIEVMSPIALGRKKPQ
jgi:hypothetical protein